MVFLNTPDEDLYSVSLCSNESLSSSSSESYEDEQIEHDVSEQLESI